MKKMNQKINKEAIILFTRVPIPGKTKTRLEKILSPQECAKLHRCFLMDLKAVYEATGKDCFIFYTPAAEAARLISILGEDVPYHPQLGEGLGERMDHALTSVLAMNYHACILIGADIPQICPDDLEEAFDMLQSKDIVLGPTTDQGYYLIGMKQPQPAVFKKLSYGHGNVLETTIGAIQNAGLTYGLIPEHEDIDEPLDLINFHKRVNQQPTLKETFTASYTKELIAVHQEKWKSVECVSQ